jgi:hypothetical protein
VTRARGRTPLPEFPKVYRSRRFGPRPGLEHAQNSCQSTSRVSQVTGQSRFSPPPDPPHTQILVVYRGAECPGRSNPQIHPFARKYRTELNSSSGIQCGHRRDNNRHGRTGEEINHCLYRTRGYCGVSVSDDTSHHMREETGQGQGSDHGRNSQYTIHHRQHKL